MKFFLGTHKPAHLAAAGVPLFVSRRTLAGRARYPRARAEWALDSGGFTELDTYGRWTVTPEQYVDEIALFADRIGNLAWAAPQDWMCEDRIRSKTGGTVAEHQARTVENLLELRRLAGPELPPIIPVLQGQTIGDYLDHVHQYAAAGVDLLAEPLVGVGSVCRRENTREIEAVLAELAGAGLRLHGFGVKQGLVLYREHLTSADSMAWSYNARRNPPLPGCRHGSTGNGRCANCLLYALAWRERLLDRAAAPRQLALSLPIERIQS